MFQRIKNYFANRPKFEVTLLFKGGQTVQLRVVYWKTRRNDQNDLIGMEYQVTEQQVMYVRLDDVSMVLCEEL